MSTELISKGLEDLPSSSNEEGDEDDAKLEAAATQIQAVYRGRIDRKALQSAFDYLDEREQALSTG